MAKTIVLVKFPGQALSYMEVPTDRINKVHESIAGLRYANVEIRSLYKNFYFILMDQERNQKKLPFNMTAYLVSVAGETETQDVGGPFAICKLPGNLYDPIRSMTPEDAAQVQKLLRS